MRLRLFQPTEPVAPRIAVVGTPRSGNTWIRAMLAAVFGVRHNAFHTKAEVGPEKLPPGFVLQMHHRDEEGYDHWLKRYGFRIATIARHPFDVLISILHFCRHDDSSARWLGGQFGTEATIRTASPRSPEFLTYATGSRARNLLAISTDWWARKDVVRIRYEAMVASPVLELAAVAGRFGTPTANLNSVVAAHAIENLRTHVTNHHFWQGRPGLWRSLLTVAEVRELVAVHAKTLAAYGYTAEADTTLTPGAADRNWAAVVAPVTPTVRKAA